MKVTPTMYAEATNSQIAAPEAGHVPIQPAGVVLGDDVKFSSVQHLLSPALHPRAAGEAPANEMKFLLVESQARLVEALLQPRMSLDPHSDPALGNAYAITTLYCDTPDYSVYYKVGRNKRRKYRLRRYGVEPRVFLEMKFKRGESVRKRRTVIEPAELWQLSDFQSQPEWQGHWFHRQLLQRHLMPVCCVQYLRTAYVGEADGGPVRFTLDRSLRGATFHDWFPGMPGEGVSMLEEMVVCEFKFRGELPALFKSVIQSLQMTPGSVSKYRQCIQAVTAVGHGRDRSA